MLYFGTDPGSYITEYTLAYEDKNVFLALLGIVHGSCCSEVCLRGETRTTKPPTVSHARTTQPQTQSRTMHPCGCQSVWEVHSIHSPCDSTSVSLPVHSHRTRSHMAAHESHRQTVTHSRVLSALGKPCHILARVEGLRLQSSGLKLEA